MTTKAKLPQTLGGRKKNTARDARKRNARKNGRGRQAESKPVAGIRQGGIPTANYKKE